MLQKPRQQRNFRRRPSGSHRRRLGYLLILTLLLIICFLIYTSLIAQFQLQLWKAPNNYLKLTIIKTQPYSDDFCVAYNVTKGKKNFSKNDLQPVSLCIHTTAHYLEYILEQAKTWDGPISVAYLVDRANMHTVQFLMDNFRCNKLVKAKMNLHLVIQKSAFQKECPEFEIDLVQNRLPCANLTYYYKRFYYWKVVPPFNIYPINYLRNIARKGAPSDIQLVSDVEMIFSENFQMKIMPLANIYINDKNKNLLVVRRFETENKVKIPRNLTELKRLFDKEKAFEFHHQLFPLGHTIEGLWYWFKISAKHEKIFAWPIEYRSASWEPMFIMHRNDPLSPEYMPTRVRDQQALTYELCRAGYRFYLVSQLFNVHKGVKENATNLDAAVRHHQTQLRSDALHRFFKEMSEKYPTTEQECGKFIM